MRCVVCDESARDHTPPEFHGMVISCAKCGNYDIADDCLDQLRALQPSERLEVLRKAKQLAKFARPSISGHSFKFMHSP
jgi:hypothetical protein